MDYYSVCISILQDHDVIDQYFTTLLIVLIPILLIILWSKTDYNFLQSGILIIIDIGAVIFALMSSSAIYGVVKIMVYFFIRLYINKKLKPKRGY